jgi:elongation factor G
MSKQSAIQRICQVYSQSLKAWRRQSWIQNRGAHAMRKRVLGVVAHIDAGKTTTSERMLYYAGALSRMGNVDAGDTTMDFLPAERERGITINSAAMSFNWGDYELFLVDSPGHLDFTFEVQRALRVMDGVVVVIDAVSGVQSQTETVWRQANQYMLPKVVYINKMDRDGADFENAVASLERRLQTKTVRLHLPITAQQSGYWAGFIDLVTMEVVLRASTDGSDSRPGRDEPRAPFEAGICIPGVDVGALIQSASAARDALVETLAEVDDSVMSAWINGDELDSTQLRRAIRKASLRQTLVPVVCGSSLKNFGIPALLDAIVNYLPSPLERPPVFGKSTEHGKVPIDLVDDGPLLALAFKVTHDRHRGQLVYMRAFRGNLTETRVPFMNLSSGKKEAPTCLLRVMADDAVAVDEIGTGDIFAAVRTGAMASYNDPNVVVDRARPMSRCIKIGSRSYCASAQTEELTYVANMQLFLN